MSTRGTARRCCSPAVRKSSPSRSIPSARNFPARKARSSPDIGLSDDVGDTDYLEMLRGCLPPVLRDFAPDLILYQPGVDPHMEDRPGRLALSDAGLEARDCFVMGLACGSDIPLASVLGGGYGADGLVVARRHVRSMLALAAEYAKLGCAEKDFFFFETSGAHG